MRVPDSGCVFASLDFDLERQGTFPVVPEACIGLDVRLSTGIVLFDILVANEDRHDTNLKTDNPGEPTRIMVFDHDATLLGGAFFQGVERLKALEGNLGITGAAPIGGTRHCLLSALPTCRHFDEWFDRIEKTPNWFIEDTCNALVGKGLKRGEADATTKFLTDRKRNLDGLVFKYRAEFTAVHDWPSLQGRLFP